MLEIFKTVFSKCIILYCAGQKLSQVFSLTECSGTGMGSDIVKGAFSIEGQLNTVFLPFVCSVFS